MTTNAIIYASSTEEAQIGKTISISEQIAECQSYADEKRWNVVRVDLDVHKRSEVCPALHRIVADSIAGTNLWDTVLVHDFAQISRDAHLFEFHRRILLIHGITIHSFTEKSVGNAKNNLARPIEVFLNRYRRDLREDLPRQSRRAVERRSASRTFK